MNEWIPIKIKSVPESKKDFFTYEVDMLDCPLPEDGQDVLVSTIYGAVFIDTFVRTYLDECYFENYDIEDIKAWMPLPEPYKGGRK